MNFQELLTRLSASCFAADRPDYDWKTLRLFPETGLSLVLIARLFAALVLCVIGALLHSMALRYVLLISLQRSRVSLRGRCFGRQCSSSCA